jgi:hypothetical protein
VHFSSLGVVVKMETYLFLATALLEIQSHLYQRINCECDVKHLDEVYWRELMLKKREQGWV